MAKPLSKRQRTQVRQIVRQEISPEWKLSQTSTAIRPIDVDSNGTGYNLFANIAQGIGPDDRVGRKVKVHRIDIWQSIAAASEPQLNSWQPFCVQLYKRKTNLGNSPNALLDRFDLSMYQYALYGPSPQLAEKKFQENIKFYKFKRYRMAGLSMVQYNAYLKSTGAVIASETTESKFTTATIVQDFPQHLHYTQVADQLRESEKGCQQKYLRHSLVFRNGLNVGFVDAAITGSYEENHIFFQCAAAANSGWAVSHPEYCPKTQVAWRVWFTDA